MLVRDPQQKYEGRETRQSRWRDTVEIVTNGMESL